MKKVKILKNNDSYNNGTFVTEVDRGLGIQTPNINLDDNNNMLDLTKEDKLEVKYKKKKVMNKKDGFNRGLKYSAPSQRNHSSVYE
ncbi:hypothetical protein [Candidatus Nitrosocosmicus franklandus]|uniref:Uncharacterized protein n=1 Tax=Candidatus Nitrosocosmicus franklandianus TaxID=1798806 RepID=A0A484IAU3_9ARCH|nr:hypothetical protein [Candidatus Nitrosocosmicus franklandus]VFJ13893.1 conserved protein of unknown function [Candidatus Nitrosocosmicus franklandus]